MGDMSFVMPAVARSLSENLGPLSHVMAVQSELAMPASLTEHATSLIARSTTTPVGEKYNLMYYIGIFVLISVAKVTVVATRCLHVRIGLMCLQGIVSPTFFCCSTQITAEI